MHNMKLFTALSILILANTFSYSQNYKLPKFKEMFDTGKFEKLAKKADKASKNDDWKKYGETHFWKAAAYLEVAKEFGFLEKYKDAYKNALKATLAGQKKDESGEDIKKFPNLIPALKKYGHLKAGKLFEDEKYSKANIFYEKLRIISDDTLSFYMNAQCLRKLKNEKEAQEMFANVCQLNYQNLSDSFPAPNTYQVKAFLRHSQYLMEQSIVDSAYKIIYEGTQLFPKEDSIKEVYLDILNNYKLFYYHYSNISTALKIAVKAANNYSNDRRFIQFEQGVLVDFAESLIIKGNFSFIQSIFQKYITRPRDPDVEKNLYEANEILVRMIADHYHKSEIVISQNLMVVMKDVNQYIRTTVLDNIASFDYEQMINETVSNLNGKDEYYLSNIFLKFARLSLPENKQIADLEKDNISLYKGLNKHLKEVKKKVTASNTPTRNDYLNCLELATKCNDFDVYEIIDSAQSKFPEDKEIYNTCKAFILNDYVINYKGSKLVKELVKNHIMDELHWSGNLPRCNEGAISPSADHKTLQRINYFRRMARLTTNLKFDAKLSSKAQHFAMELHPNFELSEKCKETKVDESDIIVTASSYASDGIHSLMLSNGDSNYTVIPRKMILQQEYPSIGHGSTNENIVLYLKEDLEKENEMQDYQQGIAWPPNGIIPATIVPKRWSISHPNADFTKAKVKIKLFGRESPVHSEKYIHDSFGYPTFVFVPEDIILYAKIDLSYEIIVYNVFMKDVEKATSFRYKVTITQDN